MKRRIFAAAFSGAVVVMFACDDPGSTGPPIDVPGPSFSHVGSPTTPAGTLYAGTDKEDFAGTLPDRLAVIEVNGSTVISTNIVTTTFQMNGLAPTGTGTLFAGDAVSSAHLEITTAGGLIDSITGPLDDESCCNEDLAFDGTHVWRADWSEGPLFQYLPDGTDVTAHALTQGVGATFVGSTLWVTRWTPKEVGEYDPSTDTFTPKFLTTGNAGGLAYDADHNILWVGETGGVVGAWDLNNSPPTLIAGSTFQPFGALSNTIDGLAFIPGNVIPDEGGEAPIEENGKKVAVVIVPEDAFDEDVVADFKFVDGPCHEFLMSQYGRCLSAEFTTLLGVPVTPDVLLTYAMCLPIALPASVTDPLIIYEFDKSTSNVIPREDFVDDLDCSEFVAAEPGNGLMRFARGLVDRVTDFFAPEPLVAAPAVFRGDEGRAWEGLASLFVWARPIDIKPGSDPNSINCTNDKGVISVAVLTTTTDGDPDNVLFDATTINANTVFFGPTGGRGPLDTGVPGDADEAQETHRNKKTGDARRHVEDVNEDGLQDMVFHFRYGDTGLTCDNPFAKLGGLTTGGAQIEGADFVRMVGGN